MYIVIFSVGVPSNWTFNTLFEVKRQAVADTTEIFSFSTNGDFIVHDIRKPSSPVIAAKHNLSCRNSTVAGSVQMNVCPANTNRFSVCGFDVNLYICEVNKTTVDVLFTHDGHSYNSGDFEPNVRTICSSWLSFITADTLVSCGSNSSVQCWQFKLSWSYFQGRRVVFSLQEDVKVKFVDRLRSMTFTILVNATPPRAILRCLMRCFEIRFSFSGCSKIFSRSTCIQPTRLLIYY